MALSELESGLCLIRSRLAFTRAAIHATYLTVVDEIDARLASEIATIGSGVD